MYKFLTCVLLLGLASVSSTCLADPIKPVQLGQSVLRLNGPWKFHTGDDARWAGSGFDDSAWESMNLYAPPDANDGDVGIAPYISGWSKQGHPNYHGYAWYRLRVAVTPPAGETLALLGPWAVDSSYQVYANGILLGGVGDFSAATPTAYGNHYPRYFELPPELTKGGPITFAIRVWAGPWVGGTGGIHVAPVIGTRDAISAQYRLQWLKIVEGYAVDVVPALLFFLAAAMVLCLWRLERANRAYPWLAAALLCSGLQRGNQAIFFWLQIETIQDYVIFILTLVGSCTLGAWMMAWRAWFKLDKPAWLPKLVAALTAIYAVAHLVAYPWLYHAAFPHAVTRTMYYLITWTHHAFLLVYLAILFLGIRREGREGWHALPTALAIGMVLFISEVVLLHVPGIWFPFGVGVSTSEYASVISVLLLSALLLRRLWSRAAVSQPTALEESPA
ncbi:MAG TPA: glycoside hydrolase [Gammaproteobacteria bacterium]|nr:glycoside hydrolase [Gammaproteobacteria bacterium]